MMREGTPEFSVAYDRWLEPRDREACQECPCGDPEKRSEECEGCFCHETREVQEAVLGDDAYEAFAERLREWI